MDETKIGMKVETETKEIESMCEVMQTALMEQFSKGIKNVDTQEMYKAVDIFKDLTEAKKNIVEACYKTYILEAMEKSEDESIVERTRRGYHEAQTMHSKETQEGKDRRLSELNKYMDELAEDMKGLIEDMSNEERTMLKAKITKLGNIIQ